MKEQLHAYHKTREQLREKITQLFTEVGEHYKSKGTAELDLHQGHDVHAFYRLAQDQQKVVHVQGYPGFSTEEQTRVFARLMDYDTMVALRESGTIFTGIEHDAGTISIGNEHDAVIRQLMLPTDIPYDSSVLVAKLEQACPELR